MKHNGLRRPCDAFIPQQQLFPALLTMKLDTEDIKALRDTFAPVSVTPVSLPIHLRPAGVNR